MSKIYEFNIWISNGWGSISVKADDENQAYDKLEDFIDKKMREAELTIDYEIELENPDDEEVDSTDED